MPLTKIQSEVLQFLAARRDPESYVGGAAPLNRNAPRFSDGIDVFHDREERVELAALEDAAALDANGYRVQWLTRLPMIYTASVTKDDDATRLECGWWTATTGFSPLYGMSFSGTFSILSISQ